MRNLILLNFVFWMSFIFYCFFYYCQLGFFWILLALVCVPISFFLNFLWKTNSLLKNSKLLFFLFVNLLWISILLFVVFIRKDEVLTTAALEKNHLVGRLALFFDANPNYKDKYGSFPLCYASANGDLTFVKMLLDYGANINQTSSENYSALACASLAYQPEVVMFLLNYGINPELNFENGTIKKNFEEIINGSSNQ